MGGATRLGTIISNMTPGRDRLRYSKQGIESYIKVIEMTIIVLEMGVRLLVQ